MLDRKIGAYQRFHKRRIEQDIAKPLVIQRLMDAGKAQEKAEQLVADAKLRWNWAQLEKPIFDMTNLIGLLQVQAQTGVEYLSLEEVRSILADKGLPLNQTKIKKEKNKDANPNTK